MPNTHVHLAHLTFTNGGDADCYTTSHDVLDLDDAAVHFDYDGERRTVNRKYLDMPLQLSDSHMVYASFDESAMTVAKRDLLAATLETTVETRLDAERREANLRTALLDASLDVLRDELA